MKTANILNIVLALALVFLCVKLAVAGNDKSSAGDGEDIVMNNILARTSVRSFQDKAVEQEKIEKLLRAGMAAPSAVNKQPWHFVVVTDRQVLDALGDANPNAGFVKKAPLAIVVCGDMTKALQGGGRDFWIQDCSAATENILLAAVGMGLGATWTGTYPAKERCQAVARVLSLPETMIPLNTIVIGYPEGNPQPKDKYNESNISYETYGGKAAGTAEDAKRKVTTPLPAEGGAEGGSTFHDIDLTSDFRGNPFTWFKGDGLLLCAGDKTSYNAMTIGWGALGNIWERGTSTMTVYVAKGRYTHEFMERTKYFTVMAFDDKEVLRYMGSHSGRDSDKVKALGLHTFYTDNGTPYFAEATEVYECEMIYHAPFDLQGMGDMPKKFYENFPAGVHSMYMGKIVRAMKK